MSNLIQHPLARAALRFWRATTLLDAAQRSVRCGLAHGPVGADATEAQRQSLCAMAAESGFPEIRTRALSALRIRGFTATASA